MKNQNLNNRIPKNNKPKSSDKSPQKPTKARDNRWNKNRFSQDDFDTSFEYKEHDLDSFRKNKQWSDC